MIKELRQGDIFEIGFSGEYQFIIVFGYLGLNQMRTTWWHFKDQHPQLRKVHDPFREKEKYLIDGKWIKFIGEQINHGMTDNELEKELTSAFQWAQKQKLYKIITNGIVNTDHSGDTAGNRMSDDRRVRFIQDICNRKEFNDLEITLTSLNDAFIRNK